MKIKMASQGIDMGRANLEKQELALNTLTNLAKQFSQRPDFDSLLRTALLALTGQFSTSGAFAILSRRKTDGKDGFFFGTGRFNNHDLLATIILSQEQITYFINHRKPITIKKDPSAPEISSLLYILSECNVELVIPLIHKSNLIGLFGLGAKVTRKPYDESDTDLLTAIIDAITPLIVNSILFYEISSMSNWYLQILNNVKQGVFVFNGKGRLIKINNRGFDMLRMIKPHLQSIHSLNNVPIELIFPDEYYPEWSRRFISSELKSGKPLFEKMKAISDREERFFNVGISIISDGSENISDFIITLDDVTDQEENEQRLFELEKFAEKGMMASSISHELNNYLGLLMGGVELSQVAIKKNKIDKAVETLGKLRDNIDKMERFTTGLMDYARLKTQKETGNLNNILVDVLSFVASQKRFRTISIITELSDNLPDFLIDADQIAQLLLNLLNNAADAIKEARPKSPKITIRTTSEGKHAHLIVSDNGIGIKDEIKDRLFKFHLTTKPDGHGYGLVTCGKIIDNHDGGIEIDSVEGKGATFKIQFPISAVMPKQCGQPDKSTKSLFSNTRI